MNLALSTHPTKLAASTLLALGLAACGGGGASSGPKAPTLDPATPTLDTAQRTLAATSTASRHSACSAIRPFYWEIGDSAGPMAGTSVNTTGSATSYDASTVMNIASASKWLYRNPRVT